MKKEEKLVVIKKIKTHYGAREADIDDVGYKSEEAKTKNEVIPQKTRKAAAEAAAKAAEEAKAPKEEASKEEAPAEEKKEEVKSEEKKE